MPILLQTIGLLLLSNVFMNLAWYGHLGSLRDRPLWIAILASWGIAFFEYVLQVPANRLGVGKLEVSQLKIMQEVISLTVFVPIAVLVLGQKIRLDYLWACLCICGAVFFVFRDHQTMEPPPSTSLATQKNHQEE